MIRASPLKSFRDKLKLFERMNILIVRPIWIKNKFINDGKLKQLKWVEKLFFVGKKIEMR
jgi:hypothetical protein